VGHRATGKTTVGRLLAARLGWSFADVDDWIEQHYGGSVAAIFAAEGEAGFRQREAAALALLCNERCRVIATGGGAILREENRALLRAKGIVIWLTAGPETIWRRLQSDPMTAARRPNLTASGGRDEVLTLLAMREPLYREAAHFIVNADEPSPETVAAAILNICSGLITSLSPSVASSSSSSG
jgi:shikimate kinase